MMRISRDQACSGLDRSEQFGVIQAASLVKQAVLREALEQ